jgi:uncharacterized membrane protein YhaH (DUF805 family)
VRTIAALIVLVAIVAHTWLTVPFEDAVLLMFAALVCAVLSLAPSASWLARKWRDAYDDAQRRRL